MEQVLNLAEESRMSAQIHLWKGFSTLIYWKKIDGKGAHLSVTSTTTESRSTPQEAWEDARRLEDEHDRYIKKESINRKTVKVLTGVCPADYMVV